MNQNSLPFKVFEGSSLLTVPEDASEPIIEDILFKNDIVMLVAEDKQGKTIMATQMACSLTVGKPFLDVFDIPEPVNVWYFAHEGKEGSIIDRLIRTGNHTGYNEDRLKVFSAPKLRWNDDHCKEGFDYLLEQYKEDLPKVIIIDPLYAAMAGDLNSNVSMGDFIHNVRCFAGECGASVILIHHMKKSQRDDKGNYYKRSDGDAYGSALMKWAVDHVFWIDTYRYAKGEEAPQDNKDRDRWFKCDTQRGGNIVNGLRLKLNHDDPLYFSIVDKHIHEHHKVMALLRSNPEGMNVAELIKRSRIARASMYIILRELQEIRSVEKYGEKTKYYKATLRELGLK